MKSFQGKRVLVTGGAGGLGQAFSRRFAADGAEIVLADLAPGPLEEAQAALAEHGVAARTYLLDVTDHAGIEELRSRLHAEAGPVHVLVNNAGVVFGGPFLDVPLERHMTTFRVNVEGVVAMTHAFLSDLLVAPEGHLVNIASASGFIGLPEGSTYAASKWAVIGFSESIRQELKRKRHRHVGVTTVCPSYVDTGMFAGVRPPRLTRFLDPDELADKVAQAVLHDRPFVLEPWLIKMTPFLKGVLPLAASDLLADLFGATSGMLSWRGHGNRPASGSAESEEQEERPL